MFSVIPLHFHMGNDVNLRITIADKSNYFVDSRIKRYILIHYFFSILSSNKCIYVRYLILFLDACLTALIDPLSHTKRLTKGTSASLQTK